MFAALARFSYRYRWPVLIFFLVLFPVAGIAGGGAVASLQQGGFDDPNTESYRATQSLLNDLGAGAADIIPLYTVQSGTAKDPANSAAITAALERVAADPAVAQVVSFYSTGAPQFLSRDHTQTFAAITLRGDEGEKQDTLDRLTPLFQTDGVRVQLGGGVPAMKAISHTVEQDLQRAEMIAFPITVVLLALVFGSLVSAGVPLLLGGLSILLTFTTLRILVMFTPISVFSANIVTMLGLGLAIDYSLFILNRYREELPHRGVQGALVTAVSTTGRAVAFSGVTVAASLIGLFVFPQVFLHSMAIGGIAVVLIAVVLSVTLLPALIAVLGNRIDALRLPWVARAGQAEEQGENGFWHRTALLVMRHPVLVAVAVVALLLTLGLPFLRFNGSTPDVRVLGTQVEARQVSDTLTASFAAHESTPHQIAVTTRGDALTAANIGTLYDYAQQVAAIPGVARVDSIFSIVPGLDRAGYQALYSTPAAQQDPKIAAGLAAYARGSHTRLAAVSAYEIDSPEAQAQVASLRSLTVTGMDIDVGGDAARLTDLKDSIRDRAPLALAVVGVVTFIVLFLVFGSVTLPIKAIAMNLLSLSASYGAIVWIFQDGRLQGLLNYTSLGSVDATQPILMFAVVFGLSMDYEVLLLSRVREEYQRTGDNTRAVALGLEKTGRLITSAALLLVVVIGSFATSSMIFIKELGVGMALAVALDATIVRALLVPATMRLMGRWNWWAPTSLTRIWRRAGLGDLEGHGAASQSAAADGDGAVGSRQ